MGIRATLFLALSCALPASAAPSFLQIASTEGTIDGQMSEDGQVVGIASATIGAFASLYHVPSESRISHVAALRPSSDGVTTPVPNSDGSVVYGGVHIVNLQRYRWTQTGPFMGITNPGTAELLDPNSPVARAVSSDGSVYVGTRGFGPFESALVGPTGEVPLGDLPGGETSAFVRGLSGDGSIAVGDSSSASGQEAFRWEGGTMTGLGDLAGGIFESEARAISRDGTTIVGNGNSASGPEAFIWSGGMMRGLGDLPGGLFLSEANAVSADGSVIGGLGVGDDGATAILWYDGVGIVVVEALLERLGIDLGEQSLLSVLDISADGTKLLGRGRETVAGANRNFLWVATIPEPETAGLLGLGLLALAGVRRRAPKRS